MRAQADPDRVKTARPSSIILVFSGIDSDMEAERLNTLEASIADLRKRAVELRGYL
jgi:hypothetical protein